MKEFTEKHHAYLVGRFYGELMKTCPDRAEDIFVMCTERYGQQRGSRMAQRAVRDKKPLTFTTYREYGEWNNTESAKQEGCSNQVKVIAWQPDCIEHVHMCPWASQFKEMGLTRCGTLYCAHIDEALVRGFNPALIFRVPQSMHENGFCVQISKEANFKENQVFCKSEANQKGFDYHCSHCYKTFTEMITAILGAQGYFMASNVLKYFEEDYGKEMADAILSFQNINFNLI